MNRRFLLVLPALALTAALAVFAVPDAAGQTSSTCQKWGVALFNPADVCKFKGSNPYATRGEFCEVPEGAEPVALTIVAKGMSYDYVWGVKKCID